ncbi:MAG: hypothetical protein E6J26_07860, partial [Chloroflexi bacterium]
AERKRLPTRRITRAAQGKAQAARVPSPAPSMPFFNGLGGFDLAAREYVIQLSAGRSTPLPWINVIANPEFGCLVSESALGFTWAINSQQNRLTPWGNDPVSDRPRELIY